MTRRLDPAIAVVDVKSIEKLGDQPNGGKTPTWRILLGIAYMTSMGVCGIVLTAIGATLDQLATNCGTTALAVSTVFLARGAG